MIRFDLLVHGLAGFFAGMAGIVATADPGAGFVVAAIVGSGKELDDARKNRRALLAGKPAPHAVDVRDLAATIIGGALATLAGSLLRGRL